MADTNADFFRLTTTNSLDQTLDRSDLANYLAEESNGFGMPGCSGCGMRRGQRRPAEG